MKLYTDQFAIKFEPIKVLGNFDAQQMLIDQYRHDIMRVLMLPTAPLKFIGINFSVDEDTPIKLERPDAEWNF